MKETIIIKYTLIMAMLVMSVFSFYEISNLNDTLFRFITLLFGCFFLYEAVRILTLKAK
jgi:hypothetical protein